MAKTSIRRHHTQRLQKKWTALLKHFSDYGISTKSLSFGRIFSKDPMDCGIPNCQVCSFGKEHSNARTQTRKEERNSLSEYNEGL
jgi:hypothetical protein